MGGLRKYMPITYWTAVDRGRSRSPAFRRSPGSSRRTRSSRPCTLSTIPGHAYAYFAVMAGVFVTAFYSFRMLFLAFHGERRASTRRHDHDATGDDAHGASTAGASRRRTRTRLVRRRSPVGGHGAADPARDSVGLRRLGVHRADAVRRLLRRLDRRPPEQHAVLTELRERMARRRRVHRSTASPSAAVLARDRRHRRRRGTATSSIRRCRRGSRARPARSTRCSTTSTTSTSSTTGSSPAARARSATSCRTSATARSSTASSSTARRESSAGRAALMRHIQTGLRLSLRVHDDHRRVRAADLVGALSADDDAVPLARHLGPDRRRPRWCSAVGRDRDAATARWIALVGARRGLRSSRCRCALHFDVDDRHDAVRRAQRMDPALRHPLPSRRRRHLDAVRAAEQLR